jgi:hypothetical protein
MSDQTAPTHPAVAQLREAFRAVELGDVDPMTAPWSTVEAGIARMLGGPFTPDSQEHATIATLVAATFGERIRRDLAGFWFPNRAAPGGVAIGFAEAPMMLSPLELVLQALARARLSMLEDVTKDLGGTLARARAEATLGAGSAPPALGPEDYRRMFDPGFVQFACVDMAKVRAVLARSPAEAARDVEDALSRLPAAVPAQVRASMRDQIAGALKSIPGDEPLSAHAGPALPLVELLVLLGAAVETTRFAPAELWQHLLLPLLHIGPATSFPPLDDEEREALRDGADPLLLYVDTVPFRTPSPDEDGLLGVFPPEKLGVLDPCFADQPTVRVIAVPAGALTPAAAGFDRNALRAAIEAFTRHAVSEAQGAGASAPNVESGLLATALELLGELVRTLGAVGDAPAGERVLCVRRAPEAEAASDTTLQELRRAMQASRIILI